MQIASRFPKVAACHAYVNEQLRKMAEAGFAPYQICYFKAGDRYLGMRIFNLVIDGNCRSALLRWAGDRTALAGTRADPVM